MLSTAPFDNSDRGWGFLLVHGGSGLFLIVCYLKWLAFFARAFYAIVGVLHTLVGGWCFLVCGLCFLVCVCVFLLVGARSRHS